MESEKKFEGIIKNTNTNEDTIVRAHAGSRVIVEMESDEERDKKIGSVADETLELYNKPTPVGDMVDSIKFKLNNQPADTFTPNPDYVTTNRPVANFLKRTGAGLMTMLGFAAAAQAGTVEKNPSDSAKGNIEVNFNAARKVQEIAPDYTKVKKDNKTYGYKITDGSQKELPKATATAGSVETPAYINTLIKHLQNGISPEELVEKGYISSDRMEEFRKYYVAPKADVVYIESEQEQPKEVPLPKFAENTQRYFGANGHAVGDGAFTVRESMDETQGGTVNTYDRMFRLDLMDEMGNPTDTSIVIPGAELQNYLVSNSTHFKSMKDFEEAKQKYSVKKGSGTYAFTGKEIADGTTLK